MRLLRLNECPRCGNDTLEKDQYIYIARNKDQICKACFYEEENN